MASAMEQLVDWLTSRNKFFYHFTDSRNLPQIDRHGLLSMDELRRRGIQPVTGGDETSLSIDHHKGFDKYVHLCFRSNHPMEYAARSEGRICDTRFLKISPSIILFNGVLAADKIVTSNDANIAPPDQMLAKLDLKVVYEKMDWKVPEIKKRLDFAEKYEILVPNVVPRELISGL